MSIDCALLLLLRPTVSRSVRAVATAELGSPGARALLEEAYDGYSDSLPEEKTAGARLMVRLAALTCALFRTMLARGVSDERARELTRDITWQVYRKMSWPTWKLARLTSREPLARVRATMDSLMRFPYARPGYRMDYVDDPDYDVAFDVTRCPVAECFAAEGLSDLCATSFCDLDFDLASEWGVELHRSLTIAQGADRCDFRFCSHDRRRVRAAQKHVRHVRSSPL